MRTEALSVLGAALLLVPAAAAEEPRLELSRDGVTWSPTLVGPILDEDLRVVPGGSTRSAVWVRNSSEDATTLSTIIRDARSTVPEEASAREDFRVRVGGSRVAAPGAGGCRVHSSRTLEPGEQLRIPVSVSLPSSSGNISQGRAVSFSVRVLLVEGEHSDPCSDAAPTVPESPGVVQTDGGPGEDSLGADLLAAALLTVGAALGLRRRARGRSSPPAS